MKKKERILLALARFFLLMLVMYYVPLGLDITDGARIQRLCREAMLIHHHFVSEERMKSIVTKDYESRALKDLGHERPQPYFITELDVGLFENFEYNEMTVSFRVNNQFQDYIPIVYFSRGDDGKFYIQYIEYDI